VGISANSRAAKRDSQHSAGVAGQPNDAPVALLLTRCCPAACAHNDPQSSAVHARTPASSSSALSPYTRQCSLYGDEGGAAGAQYGQEARWKCHSADSGACIPHTSTAGPAPQAHAALLLPRCLLLRAVGSARLHLSPPAAAPALYEEGQERCCWRFEGGNARAHMLLNHQGSSAFIPRMSSVGVAWRAELFIDWQRIGG